MGYKFNKFNTRLRNKLSDKLRNKLRNKLVGRRGSYTLEAVLILPIIMLILFFLAFFSMWVYQRLVVLDAAIYTATQRAVSWDNSVKDLETGSKCDSLVTDGLYWRLYQDFDDSDLAVTKCWAAKSLANAKLGTGVFKINSQDIVVKYDNQGYQRKVTAQISQNVLLPRWMNGALGSDLQGQADALVIEPTEYIRTVDFLVKLPAELRDIGGDFQQQEPQNARVYVTKNQYDEKVFHSDPNCRYVKRIVENGNLVILPSAQEAEGGGYRHCKVCAAKG